MKNSLPLLFYPTKIAWRGAMLVGACCLLSVFLGQFWVFSGSDLSSCAFTPLKKNPEKKLTFSCFPCAKEIPFALPQADREISFFTTVLRPDEVVSSGGIWIQLNQSKQAKYLILPGKFYLTFDAKKGWIFAEKDEGIGCGLEKLGEEIFCEIYVTSLSLGEPIKTRQKISLKTEIIEQGKDSMESSVFSSLLSAKWKGIDLLTERPLIYKLEVGAFPNVKQLDIPEENFLFFEHGQWNVGTLAEAHGKPLAKIQKSQKSALHLEGWDEGRYFELILQKNKGQLALPVADFLQSVRIRSEKQISCSIEKQFLLLRSGDWVFKDQGKWRVLRQKKEKQQFLQGVLQGELFIFDEIARTFKGPAVQGRLFSKDRSEMIAIDCLEHNLKEKKGT